MRKITAHQINICNSQLCIEAVDEANKETGGGACHHFTISGFHTRTNAAMPPALREETLVNLIFQNGPIDMGGNGVNGITHEALLAIILDRMHAFQKGPYACRENALAITKLEEALHWLEHRTKARFDRGVEGTLTV